MHICLRTLFVIILTGITFHVTGRSYPLNELHGKDDNSSLSTRVIDKGFVTDPETHPASLKVEFENNPLGMDVEKPRFSWQMVSSREGESQTAYRIIVNDEKGTQVWNSGKVFNDHSLQIEYQGDPLKPATRYHWQLLVWSRSGKVLKASSWFETGLMDTTLSGWSGAEWIGGHDRNLVLYPDYLPAFNISYCIRLDQNSQTTKAGFVYGANDPRLMNKNRNIYNIQNSKDESYVEVELDISGLKHDGSALINFYRVGYAPSDSKEKTLQQIKIPHSLIHPENMYSQHTIYLKTMYSVTEVFIDGEEESNKVGQVIVNPIGGSWDFICFPLLCDIGFSVKPGQTAFFSDVLVRNYRVPNNVLFSENITELRGTSLFNGKAGITIKDGGYLINGSKTGKIITTDISKKSMPLLRSEFTTKKDKIAKARLYITARGIYEAFINGNRIGSDYFNPGLTQYNKHHLYQTYDVTEFIKHGNNAIGVMLGEGWWSGAVTYMGYLWNLFGDRQSLLSKLVITYDDGSQQTIVSNPDTWQYYDNGPIVYSSFFQGEVYDARKESNIQGWTEPKYDARGWKKPAKVNQEMAIESDPVIETNKMPAVNDFSKLKLIGQFGPTVKKIDELIARSVEEVRPGVFVYDMGQNMVGVPHIDLQGMTPGTEIRLRYAEVRYPDMPEYGENAGMLMLENSRGALSQDIYIARGGKEVIHPRFTFHGYRYIEISGIKQALPLKFVKGDVLSSLHELSSSYETSNPKVNKLWENITWSAKGNFLSIPTDCPQRNERMGWSGDISVFSKTATYLGDMAQFLDRHMMAMRDTQREDGRFADVAPIGGGFGGILWGSAGITVAWENYLQYNNKRMLEAHYDAMKKYIKYLTHFINPESGLLTEGTLGDWLGPEQEKNDNTLLWEAYYIYDLDIMRRIAAILKNDHDEKLFNRMYQERKAFFNRTYVKDSTGETLHSGFGNPEKRGSIIGTQTSYVLPLAFDILNKQNTANSLARLIERIKEPPLPNRRPVYQPYSLMTGFIGTAWINRVLSDYGHSDAAYRILQQEEYPSWLYSVNQGATTIWERLNSYTKENGFSGNNSMNSFNHYSFGAVGSWMINYSIGIERDEQYPGFKHFILRPEPDPTGKMKWAKGHYDSPYGRIKSSWNISGDSCHFYFLIPANTTATFYLPMQNNTIILLNGKPFSPSNNYLSVEDGKIKINLPSGTFHFTTINNFRPLSFNEYEYDVKDIVGYGPVNNWSSLDFEKWLDLHVPNKVNWATIEFFAWNNQDNCKIGYYDDPEALREPYRKLVNECRKRKIVLFVSLVNDNKGSGKYGDDKKDLSYYKSQIRKGREIVLAEGPEGVVLQAVAETKTQEGKDFEAETITMAHQKGFKTCWNNHSRPKESNGCTYFAYHPASTADVGPIGCIVVTDHGQILKELSKDGKNVYGPYDPVKVSNYAHKVHQAGKGFIHYGFGDKTSDIDTIVSLRHSH